MWRNGFLIAFIGVSAPVLAETAITVAAYNHAAVPASTLRAAQSEVSLIFRKVGISIVWKNCPVDHALMDAGCVGDGPLSFVLGIRPDDPRSDAPRSALGFAMVMTARANTACVIYSRVLTLVQERPGVVPAGQLLAYAMVHELGHLLLRSDAHTTGIMHDNWQTAELRAMAQRRLTFTRDQAELLRQAVAGRLDVEYASTLRVPSR